MYDGPDRLPPVIVSASKFPVAVNAGSKRLQSLTTITRIPQGKDTSISPASRLDLKNPMLYVLNAEINFKFASPAGKNSIAVPHPFARDRESDPVYSAVLDFSHVIPEYVNGIEHGYSAFMTSMNLYINPEDSPLKDLVEDRKNGNHGYPYLPPAVSIVKYDFPFAVKIQTFYMSDAELSGYLSIIQDEVTYI